MQTLVIDTSYGSTVGMVGHDPIVETDSRTHVEKLQVNIATTVEQAGLKPENIDRIKAIAAEYKDAKDLFYIGRGMDWAVAQEGALKLKEIAYTFTEGFAAGELKHGPIALVDEGEPVVFIVPPARGRNVLHAKVISGI